MLRFLWLATRGYRLRPWASPYLLWRIETFWGLHADRIDYQAFCEFVACHRLELMRFLRWAGRMRRA
jgi:hypothetical protein